MSTLGALNDQALVRANSHYLYTPPPATTEPDLVRPLDRTFLTLNKFVEDELGRLVTRLR